MKRAVQIEPNDNVAVVMEEVSAGETVVLDGTGEMVTAVTAIPFPHKISLVDIPEGATIYKYGCPIGWANTDIRKGEHVHVHNVDFPNMQET